MKKKNINIGLLLILISHVILLVLLFVFVRKEYHSDEVWSYGIANSSVAGALFEDESGNSINIGKWFDGTVLQEYLTVQKEECFHFKNTYINAKNDFHPPLTFFLIHLVGSFFPNVFSFWFFIPFNIIAMLMCDVCIYRILKLYDIPEPVCLAGCVLSAFCTGGISMAMYLRMYTLLAAFGIILFYISLFIIKEKNMGKKQIFSLAIVNVLGALTCYEYYVFAFLVALSVCMILLFRKQIKNCFAYGFTMLGSILVSFALFPDAISDMIGNIGGKGFSGWESYPYFLQMKMLISMVLNNIFGIMMNPYEPFFASMVPYLLVIGYSLLIILPFLIYIKKEKNSFVGLRRAGNRMINRLKCTWEQCKGTLPLVGISLFVIITFIAMMNDSITVYQMKGQSVRYLFVIYPLVELIFIVLLYSILVLLIGKKRWVQVSCFAICCAIVALTAKTGSPEFLQGEGSSGKSPRDIKNAQVILLLGLDPGLERLAASIDWSNSILAIQYKDLDQYRKEIKKVDMDKDIYVFVQESALVENVLTDTLKNNSEGIDFNNKDDEVNNTRTNNLKKIEKNIQSYFVDTLSAGALKKIGTYQTVNDGFILYQISE